MTIGKVQLPIADFSQNLQPVPLQQAPANVMPILIGMPMPFPSAPSIELPSASYNTIPIPLPQLNFSSWNMGLNMPAYPTNGLLGTTPNIFSSFPQIDYSQIFKNNISFPMFGTQFGSLTRPTQANTETYTYDQATVDKLVNKYNGALSHVGDKQAFVQKVVGIAQRHNVDPNAILVIFYSEGGINPKSAGGLFGLMPAYSQHYAGVDIEGFKQMSAMQQLDIYEKVLTDQLKRAYGTDKPSTKVTGSVLYAMNFTPAYVKDALEDVKNGGQGILVSANSSDPDKRRFYNANCGKGTLADGTDHISFDTIQARLNRKEREASSLA